jgi:HemX protein
MYLLQHKMLKQKRWTPLLRRLPSLDKLELFAYRLNMLAVPLLLLSLLLGTIWGYIVLPYSFWIDPKVWMSILVLVAYSFLLYKWLTSNWQGRRLAVGNITAFLIVVLNVLATDFSKFHQWL